MLFATKREIDDLDRALHGSFQKKTELKSDLDSLKSCRADDEIHRAQRQLLKLRKQIDLEESIEAKLMNHIFQNATWNKDIDTLNSLFKNGLASAESKRFADDLYDHAELGNARVFV